MDHQSTQSTQSATQQRIKVEGTGFHLVPDAIYEVPGLSVYGLVVYGVLCQHASAEDRCWPGYARISRMARCSVFSVKRGLAELTEAGIVQVVHRMKNEKEQDSNLYVVRRRDLLRGGGISCDDRGVCRDTTHPLSCDNHEPCPMNHTQTREREAAMPPTATPSHAASQQPGPQTNISKADKSDPTPGGGGSSGAEPVRHASSGPTSREGSARPIYHQLEAAFKAANPEAYAHCTGLYAREGPYLRTLESMALEHPEPAVWADRLLQTFREMRDSGDKLYAQTPFLASCLCAASIFPRVLNEMKRRAPPERRCKPLCPKCGDEMVGGLCMRRECNL